MIVFDRYVPETWLNQGIVVAVPVVDEQTQTGLVVDWGRSIESVASATVVAIGMALATISFSAEVAVAAPIEVKNIGWRHASSPGAVTPEYWQKLTAMVRDAPLLPPDDKSNDALPLA